MNTSQGNESIKDVVELYLYESEHIKCLSKVTIKGYRELCFLFLALLPEIQVPKDINVTSLNIFFNRLNTRSEANMKPSTIRTYHDKLMVFFRWLEAYNYVSRHSITRGIVKPPKPQYDDIKALTEEQVSKIIGAITQHSIKNVFQFKRDILIVQLFLYTGIRTGELLGLRVSDINWNDRLLHIRANTSKSKRSRTLPLNSLLLESMKSFIIEREKEKVTSEALIVSQRTYHPLTRDGLKHWAKRYSKHVGFHFYPHQFRHTFACTLAKNNSSVTLIKGLLGHVNSSTTEKYLRSIRPESAHEEIERLRF